jgi:hypothetical protein
MLVSRAEAQGRGGRPQNGKDQEQKAVLDDLGPACGHVQAGLELNGTNGREKRCWSFNQGAVSLLTAVGFLMASWIP